MMSQRQIGDPEIKYYRGANNQAIFSLILGAVSLISCLSGHSSIIGIICGIIGLILGNNARRILPKDQRTIATIGWICSIAGLSIWACMLIFLLGFFGLIMSFASQM